MDLAGSISRSIHTANGDSGSHCNKQSIGKGWRLRNTCNRADTSRIQHLMTPAWRWPMSCKLASVKSCFGTLGPRGTGYSTASISTPVWGRGARSDQSATCRGGKSGRTIAQPAYIKTPNFPPYATSLFSSIPSTRLSNNSIFCDQTHSNPSSIYLS